ncbi:MAG: SH3 domain-containing protein [Leptolyngbyaceae cyanobacterium MO_188.B28]|nr:SH3 domain-containing protein [Leptolyngbyaceae cyanobacterium MO_188.B28]
MSAGLICLAMLGNLKAIALPLTETPSIPSIPKGARTITQPPSPYEKPPSINSAPLISQPSRQLSRTEPPHRPIELIDRVVAGSDFAQFRDRLQRAIRNRDANFVQSVLPPEGIQLGIASPGIVSPLPLAELHLEQTDSWFWKLLEKMMRLDSCELEDHPGSIPDAAIWACPNIANTFYRQNPPPLPMMEVDEGANPVVVIGQGVNVRIQPRIGASIVGVLYNEVVTFDQTAWNQQGQQRQRTLSDPMTGWTPVILPNQAHGYVYNRYAYKLRDPRALFEHVNGEWRLFHIVMGE